MAAPGPSGLCHTATTLLQQLSQTFTFAELDMRTSELLELVDDCNSVGLNLAELEALCSQQQHGAARGISEPQPKRQRSASDLTSSENHAHEVPMIDVSGLE